MRDLDALLNSLVNIDVESLVAILSSESEAAQRLVNSARQRTASQRARRNEAIQHAARINRILSFFQHGKVAARCLSATSCSASLFWPDCGVAAIHDRAVGSPVRSRVCIAVNLTCALELT